MLTSTFTQFNHFLNILSILKLFWPKSRLTNNSPKTQKFPKNPLQNNKNYKKQEKVQFFDILQYSEQADSIEMLKYHSEVEESTSIAEPPPKKYILIRQHLHKTFDQEQWKQVSKYHCQWSAKLQDKIFSWLMCNEQLFQLYFHIFYRNHVTLFHWFLLSSDRHEEIKPYLNKKLLMKTQQRYQKQMKNNLLINAKEKQKQGKLKLKIKHPNNQHSRQHSQHQNKCKLQDLSNQIFSYMTKKQKPSQKQPPKHYLLRHTKNMSDLSTSPRTPIPKTPETTLQDIILLDPQSQSQSQPQKPPLQKKIPENNPLKTHDFHDLFVRTFQACDGPRYIFYNYEKHMKGINEKDKYNMFIRSQSKVKIVELRLTESSEEEPMFRDYNNEESANWRSSYQYSLYGNAVEKNFKKKSKIVFRKVRSHNIGKFIRK